MNFRSSKRVFYPETILFPPFVRRPFTCTRPAAIPLKVSGGFTLIELLVVMAIIVLMTSLAGPAMKAIRSGGDLTMAASNISDVLQQARAYAMAKSTYVYVGIKEVDETKGTLAAGIGTIAIAVVASQNGERPYGDTPAPLPEDSKAGNAVIPISRLQRFENIHLADNLSSDGGMKRETDGVVNLATSQAATTFQWPVGGSSSSDFERVIEFDPQGVARMQTGGTATIHDIRGWIEIPLQKAHGNTVSADEKNQAAIQVDGMTGSVRVFRP